MMQERNKQACTPSGRTPVPTLGLLLSDGGVIEAVRPPETASLKLLALDGEDWTSSEQLEVGDTVYCLPEMSSAWLDACRFPSLPESGHPELLEELFGDLLNLLTQTVAQSAENAELLTFFVLATWVADVLPLAPVLVLLDRGEYATEVVARCLHALCRRSVVLAEFNRASCLQMLPNLSPTLFLDQASFSPLGAPRLLAATRRPGAHLLCRGQPIPFAFPKVIRGPDVDELSDALCVTPTFVGQKTLANLDVSPIAAEFQPRLLTYRMLNLRKVRDSGFTVPELDWSLQALGRSLGMCLEGHTGLQKGLLHSLEACNREARIARGDQIEAVVLEALLASIHHNESAVRVAQVCDDVNLILKLRGECRTLTDRGAGSMLKRLGLATESLDNQGRGIRLSKAIQEKVHQLAHAYSPRTPLEFKGCQFCRPNGQHVEHMQHVEHIKNKKQGIGNNRIKRVS